MENNENETVEENGTVEEYDHEIDNEREFTQAFGAYKSTFDFARKLRMKTVTKLSAIVEDIKIDPSSDKPSLIDSKRGLIESTLGALNDLNKQQESDVKLKHKFLNEQQQEQAADIGNAVINLLSSISVSGALKADAVDQTAIDEKINAAISGNSSVSEITDGEMTVAQNALELATES